MNREDIIAMAREAGLDSISLSFGNEVLAELDTLKEFAALIAAAEREACAKACDDIAFDWHKYAVVGPVAAYNACAAAIRARSNT